MVQLQLRQLEVPPGQRVILQDVTWQEFEAILEELGEHRATRLAYDGGTLEIRTSLPAPEKAKVILGDLVKILLEELRIDCECFGSTTFKRQDMAQGIEPDDSFYIQNYAKMIDKERIDLTIDPPPDLAIEVDVTSRTQLSAYEALGFLNFGDMRIIGCRSASSKTESMLNLTLALRFQNYRSLKSSLSTLNKVEHWAEAQRSEHFGNG
jgi:Uma2 family endonuclease